MKDPTCDKKHSQCDAHSTPFNRKNISYQMTTRCLKKVPTFILLISRHPKHLEEWFCTFFNSPAFAESKNSHISMLGLKLKKNMNKNEVRIQYLKW